MQHHYSPTMGHITYNLSDVATWRYAAMCRKAKQEGRPNPAHDDTTKDGLHRTPSKYQQARTRQLMQEDMELIELIAADTLIAYELKHKVRKLEQRLQHLGELQQLEQRIAELRQQEGRLKASCHQWRKTWAMHAALSANESQARSPLGLGHSNAQTPTHDWDHTLQHSTSSLPGNSDNRPTRQVRLEASQDESAPQQVANADHTADATCQVTSEGVQSVTLRGWLRRLDEPGVAESADNAAGHSCQVKSEDVQPLSLVRWLRQWVAPARAEGKTERRSSSCSEPKPATTDPGITATDVTCVVYQNPMAKTGETAPDSNRVSSTTCSDRPVASGRNSNTNSTSYRCSSTSGVTDFYHDNLSVAADAVSAVDETAMPGPEIVEAAEELPPRSDSPWQDEKPLLHGVLHNSYDSTGPLQPNGVQCHLRKFQKHCKNILSKSRRSDSALASYPSGTAESKARAASGIWRRSSAASSTGRSSVWDWGSHGNLEKLS